MTSRYYAVAILGVLVSGCANERAGQWGPAQHLGASGVNLVAQEARASTATAEAAEYMITGTTAAAPLRKTLGGKVLSAMALERVTGRKPDPSRLREID